MMTTDPRARGFLAIRTGSRPRFPVSPNEPNRGRGTNPMVNCAGFRGTQPLPLGSSRCSNWGRRVARCDRFVLEPVRATEASAHGFVYETVAPTARSHVAQFGTVNGPGGSPNEPNGGARNEPVGKLCGLPGALSCPPNEPHGGAGNEPDSKRYGLPGAGSRFPNESAMPLGATQLVFWVRLGPALVGCVKRTKSFCDKGMVRFTHPTQIGPQLTQYFEVARRNMARSQTAGSAAERTHAAPRFCTVQHGTVADRRDSCKTNRTQRGAWKLRGATWHGRG